MGGRREARLRASGGAPRRGLAPEGPAAPRPARGMAAIICTRALALCKGWLPWFAVAPPPARCARGGGRGWLPSFRVPLLYGEAGPHTLSLTLFQPSRFSLREGWLPWFPVAALRAHRARQPAGSQRAVQGWGQSPFRAPSPTDGCHDFRLGVSPA